MSVIRELVAFILASGLAIVTFGLCYTLARYYNRPLPRLNHTLWPLLLAMFLFVVSRFLPTLPQFLSNPTFVQHFVGGGIVCALIYAYFIVQLKPRIPLWLELLGLFSAVSTLGVINELIEYAVTASGFYSVDGSDVWSDMLANTLGAIAAYAMHLILINWYRKNKKL